MNVRDSGGRCAPGCPIDVPTGERPYHPTVAGLAAVVGMNVTNNFYVFAAFGAGVISFVSPCVLPIVPGYLSPITGLWVGEIREQQRHYLKRIAVNTGLFVLGFTIVFVLLGLLTTAVGSALFRNQETLTRLSGALVLLMAAYLAGS